MREGPSGCIVRATESTLCWRATLRIHGMSYLVLARKYRPRNFSEMVGQDHVVQGPDQCADHAAPAPRLPVHRHPWRGQDHGVTHSGQVAQLPGPDGNGGITASPCGVCQACTDIDSGRFVDYTELDAASNRGVDEVQTLLEQAVYKPVQGASRCS
jgi:DNA polymerase-3 subunit gamma/tau